MKALRTWTLVALIALLLVGLLAWARGPVHHRGDDVGTTSMVGEARV
jgi:hypothetical protein